MKQLCLFITLSCVVCACSNKVADTDWNKLEIKGKVKSIEQSAYRMKKKYQGFGDYEYIKGEQIRTVHFMFPCIRNVVIFNKLGLIEEIRNESFTHPRDINDGVLRQCAKYDKVQLSSESLFIEEQPIYSYSYDSEGDSHHVENLNDDVCVKAFLARKSPLIDLYSSMGNWRSWFPMKQVDKTRMNFSDTIVVSSNGMYFFYNKFSNLTATYVDTYIKGIDGCSGYKCAKQKKESYTHYANGKLKFIGCEDEQETFRFNYNESNDNLKEVIVYGKSAYTKDDELERISFDYNEQNYIKRTYHRDRIYRYDGKLYYHTNSVYFKYDLNDRIVGYTHFYKTKEEKTLDTFYAETNEMIFEYSDDYLVRAGDYSIYRDDYGLLDSISSQKETIHFKYHSFEDFSLKNVSNYAELKDLGKYTKVETTYDEIGNWTSRTCFKGDIPVICYERKIEYY